MKRFFLFTLLAASVFAATPLPIKVDPTTGAIADPVSASTFANGNALATSAALASEASTRGSADGALSTSIATKETPTGAQAKADAAQSAAISAAATDATSKANAAQAYAIQRGNHTGSQAISTVTGLSTSLSSLNGQIIAVGEGLSEHANDTNNPHSVTAAQVGLGSVNDTSDTDKPVSTAQAAADAAVLASAATDATTKVAAEASTRASADSTHTTNIATNAAAIVTEASTARAAEAAKAVITNTSTSYTPADGTWVAWVRADDIAGSDGAAITSITPSAGTSGAFTGTGTLRTGSNGINSHKALSLNGSSNAFASTLGGASLTGDWYASCVVRISSLTNHQDFISWGDGSVTGKRRSLHKFYTDNLFSFIGQTVDVFSSDGPLLAASTNYLLEISSYNSVIKLYVNGLEYDSGKLSLSAYTSTVLRLGQNPAAGEFFNGLMAEAFFKSSVPSPAEWRALRGYVSTTYGITVSGSSSSVVPVAGVSSATSITEGWGGSKTGSVVVGAGDPILIGGTVLPFTVPAALSVNGSFGAHAGSGEHMFSNYWPGQNTVAVWNKSKAGLSVVRFLHYKFGDEMGAIGYCTDLEPWGPATTGAMFMEFANSFDPSRFGLLRLVQTKSTGGIFCLRHEIRENGDFFWFNQTANSDGARATLMSLINSNGNFFVKGVISSGSTPTTLTDSAGKVLSAALNTVGVAQGGTGAVTLTGLVKGNGASAMTAAVAGTDYLAPSVTPSGPVRLKAYTVATLPAGTQGDTAFVTDALAPTFLTAVVGGGSVVTKVFYDGTNWVNE